MSKPPKTDVWYPFFIGDYRKDTARLSCEQHGAYRQLIDEYWVTGPLPDNDEILARIVGLDPRTWRKHRAVIARYFTVADGEWRHGRIDRELVSAGARKAKAEARAKAGAQARWGRSPKDATSNASSMPEAMLVQCPPPSPTPDGVKKDADASSVGSDEPIPTDGKPKAEPWAKDADFGKFWDAATPKMRARAKSRAKVWPEWRAARKWWSAADLTSALGAYLRGDPDVERTGGPGLHLWLRDKTFETWVDQPAPLAVVWEGPAEVREAVRASLEKPAYADSYLKHCAWQDVPEKALITENGYIADLLRRECGKALASLSVKVLLKGRAVA